MKKLFFFFILSILATSCSITKDMFPNPSQHNYHRMEFDIISKEGIKKEIGIGNIFIKKGTSLSDYSFRLYGLYKGNLYMKSNACGIDISRRFEGMTYFKLSDIIPEKARCSIKIVAETDAIKNRQHNIVESGVVKITYVEERDLPVTMEYTRTNTFFNGKFKTYSYLGQGSIQRQEGDVTNFEKFKVITSLKEGGMYRIAGCGHEFTDSFDMDSFEVGLKDLYNQNYLKTQDTCDYEIRIIPNEILASYSGRFSINIYGKSVVKLANPEWSIKRRARIGKKRIYILGDDRIIMCNINSYFNNASKCSQRYYSNKIFWIRTITSNARKSVFAIKNNKIFWKE